MAHFPALTWPWLCPQDVCLPEFHAGLMSLGIELDLDNAQAVMDVLDNNSDGHIDILELGQRIAAYRRKRRAFAAKILTRVFEYIRKTNASATRIFSR